MAAWAEHDHLECKVGFDGSAHDKARLAREVVALANAGGGGLVYGVDDDRREVGVDHATLGRLDAAKVGDYLGKYIGEQRIGTTVDVHEVGKSWIVEIRVEGHPAPPVVMVSDGTHGSGTQQKTLFRRGDVLTRSSTRARLAGPADIARWLEAAERRGEQRILDMVRLYAERPPGYEMHLDLPDTSVGRLRQAVAAYRDDERRLLDGESLLRLAVDPEVVDLAARDLDVAELVLQSALRKKATLWWWLARIRPEAGWLEAQLRRVLDALDRDVSDSGVALLEVAATACPAIFDDLRRALASSTKYAHFRAAAAKYPTRQVVLEALQGRAAGTEAVTTSDVLQLLEDTAASGAGRGPVKRLSTAALRLWADSCAEAGDAWT
jgi:hypothetical protein